MTVLGPSGIPGTNTHVHIPPNFSTDTTLDALLAQARSEGLRAVGTSNFFDLQVLPSFIDRARDQGVHPLLGVEMITVDTELEKAGWTINDPANPGRYYLQGRGLNADLVRSGKSETARVIKEANDLRGKTQVELLCHVLQGAGAPFVITAEQITSEVAERNQVPTGWVSLQERHISRAFADRLVALPTGEVEEILRRAFGAAPTAVLSDPGSVQTELRARLLKYGQPAFVADSPVTFAQGHEMALELGGFPAYCAVADGAKPICDYEQPAAELARRILEGNIFAAELITIRNTVKCVDQYVAAFLDAGLLVMGGSEHNTPNRLPLALACLDGPISVFAARAFWEGACVVAAHQDLVARGETGFVSRKGELITDRSRRGELAAHGAELIAATAT